MSDAPYGYRIVGSVEGRRRLVDAGAALAAYAACDAAAQVDHEAYLSAFQFPTEFRDYLTSTGSTRGYDGRCWSSWLWFDIDREGDLDAALLDARRLVGRLLQVYRSLDDDDVLAFFSGSKGYHVGLPLPAALPPSTTFHRVGRKLAETVADQAGARIDAGVYDCVRAFRAPNSRHPRTGLHKRRLTHDELMRLSAARIVERAKEPAPFDLPPPAADPQLATDWADAAELVEREQRAKAQRRADTAAGNGRLTRRTIQTIRGEDIDIGDRHRLLFSAAANLAELGCPAALAHELLTEAGLDAGLPPAEVRRQIDCGLAHGVAGLVPADAVAAPVTHPAAG